MQPGRPVGVAVAGAGGLDRQRRVHAPCLEESLKDGIASDDLFDYSFGIRFNVGFDLGLDRGWIVDNGLGDILRFTDRVACTVDPGPANPVTEPVDGGHGQQGFHAYQ
jgi:hypothetical protein